MNSEYLRAMTKRQPFEQFVISMSDGRSFKVVHPDYLLMPPEQLTSTFFVFNPDGGFDILSMRQVTGVASTGEPPTVPPRKRRGGEFEPGDE